MNEEASLKDPETILIHSDYMHLQDLGSSGYTEFDNDGADIVDLYIEKEELMETRCGLIHSHHTMDAFFSGTDQEELHEKAEQGLYLSLIVNNHMAPVAKIAWVSEIEKEVETKVVKRWHPNIGFKFGEGEDDKPEKETEIWKIFHEIDLEIEFDEMIDESHKRYEHLDSIQSRSTQYGKRFYGHGSGVQYNRQTPATTTKAKQTTMFPDKAKETSTAAVQAEGKTLFEILDESNMVQKSFAAILTQNPKTDLTFNEGLTDATNEVKDLTNAENEKDNSKETYSTIYERNAKEHAFALITAGDAVVAEMIGEFFVDDEEYHELLQKMYDYLSTITGGIFVNQLKAMIVHRTIPDELDEESNVSTTGDQSAAVVINPSEVNEKGEEVVHG